MAKEWNISRSSQDELALASHERAVNAKLNGFFDDLLVTVGGNTYDNLPRADTSLERLAKLKPAFDRASGKGTLTAGNSSPLTDGAAGVWVANDTVAKSLANDVPCVRLLDYETAAVDITAEGLLMAPSYAIARLLKRNDLAFDDIALFELHEAFAAQVHCNIAAIESREFLRERVAIDTDFGEFPWDRLNPNGGSLALGHPFGATGARILSQAVKELASMASGSIALVSVCADGGLGTVCLLQNP